MGTPPPIPTCISEWNGEPALQPQTFDPLTASCTASFPGSPPRITALLLLNRSLAIHSTTCGTHGDPWVAGGKLPLQLPLPLLNGVGEGEEVEKNQGRHGWTGGKMWQMRTGSYRKGHIWLKKGPLKASAPSAFKPQRCDHPFIWNITSEGGMRPSALVSSSTDLEQGSCELLVRKLTISCQGRFAYFLFTLNAMRNVSGTHCHRKWKSKRHMNSQDHLPGGRRCKHSVRFDPGLNAGPRSDIERRILTRQKNQQTWV